MHLNYPSYLAIPLTFCHLLLGGKRTIVVSTVFMSVIALMCSCQCQLLSFVQIPREYMSLFFLCVVSLNFTFPRLAFINLLCSYIIPGEELWIIVHENRVIFRLVPL